LNQSWRKGGAEHVGNKNACIGFGGQKPPRLQLGQSFAQGGAGHTKPGGQIALSRQALAGPQNAAQDELFDLGDNRAGK